MSTNVGWATLTIIPSMKGFSSALTKQVQGPLAAAGQSGGATAGNSWAGAFKRIALAALTGVAAQAVKNFTMEAVQAASDLEQSFGSVNAIFAESAGQIQEWSSTASREVGLSKSKYNELATLLGAQLKNTGTPMGELAGKTQELITLGADLAATYNTTVEEAVRAISATFRGERDPIEKYGITLRQAEIDAAAASEGYEKVNGKLTAQGNAVGTLKLLYEQAAVAQGMFDKEQDTYAVKLQQTKAAWTDLKAAIGELFMPVAKQVLDWANGILQPLAEMCNRLADARAKGEDVHLTFDKVAAVIMENVQKNEEWNGKLEQAKRIAEALTPVYNEFKEALSKLGKQVMDVVGAFSPLKGLMEPLRDLAIELVPILKDMALNSINNLTKELTGIEPGLRMFTTELTKLGKEIIPDLTPIIVGMQGVLSGIAGIFWEIGKQAIECGYVFTREFGGSINILTEDILPRVLGGFSNLLGFLRDIVGILGREMGQVMKDSAPEWEKFLNETILPIITQFDNLDTEVGDVKDEFKDLLGWINELIQPFTRLGTTILNTVLSPFKDLEGPTWAVKENLKALNDSMPNIKGALDDMATTIEQKVAPKFEFFLGKVRDVGSYLAGAFAPVTETIGKELFPALTNAGSGVAECFGAIFEALGGLAPLFVALTPPLVTFIEYLLHCISVLIYFATGVIKIMVGTCLRDWELMTSGMGDLTKGWETATESDFAKLGFNGKMLMNQAQMGMSSEWAQGMQSMETNTSDSMANIEGTTDEKVQHIMGKMYENTDKGLGDVKGLTDEKMQAIMDKVDESGDYSLDSWKQAMDDLGYGTEMGAQESVVAMEWLRKRSGEEMDKAAGDAEEKGEKTGKSFGEGLKKAAGFVSKVARALMGDVTAFMPSSPAKKGPLSGKGYTLYRGEKMVEDFGKGMLSATPVLASASRTVASTAVDAVAAATNLGAVMTNTMSGTTTTDQWRAMSDATNLGMTTIANTMQTGMTNASTAWNDSWNNVALATDHAWYRMELDSTTGMSTVQAKMTETMTALQTSINTQMPPIQETWTGSWSAMELHAIDCINNINTNLHNGLQYQYEQIGWYMNENGIFWKVRWQQMWINQCQPWSEICNNVYNGLVYMYNTMQQHMNDMQMTWTNGWNAIRNVVEEAWNAATQACRDGMAHVIEVIRELPNNIRNAIGDVGSILKASGESAMNGFIEGIRAAGNRVGDAVGRSISGMADGFSSAESSASSSADNIADSMERLGVGMQVNIGSASASLEDAYSGMTISPKIKATPEVSHGGLVGALQQGSAKSQPLIGNLTIESKGNVRDDMNEALFQLRRIQRGGAHA